MVPTLSTLEDVQKTYDWFEQMRDTQPVWLDESSGCWHVFRYEDVLKVISDYSLFSSERRRQRFQARAASRERRRGPASRRQKYYRDGPTTASAVSQPGLARLHAACHR